MSIVSARIKAADAAFAAVRDFYLTSRYGERRGEPGICDFTFGNPQEMPIDGTRHGAARARTCRTTRTGSPTRQAKKSRKPFSPNALEPRTRRSPFEPADIALTAGAFAAIMVAFRLVLDAGDEAIFSEPAWFCYEPMLLAADAVPRKVKLKASTFDLDLAAIEAAIGPQDPARHRQHAAQSDRSDLRP